MMNLDIVVLAGVVVTQQCFILGLVNRLLITKGVLPLHLPSVKKLLHDEIVPERPEGKRVKPIMTIPIGL